MRPRFRFLLPSRAFMALLFAAPMAIVAAYSLLTRGAYGGQGEPWTIENYGRMLDPLYLGIVLKSFWIAAVSTALCLLLGFPLALFIARARSSKALWLGLVTLPFWTSFLVRTYAWMFLLRDTGLINTILLALGLISEPLPLLYNDGAVVLGLVYGYLPFMVLPLYAVLERLDPWLLEAAEDLGAKPWQVVWRVVVPLAKPGMNAGAVLVFVHETNGTLGEHSKRMKTLIDLFENNAAFVFTHPEDRPLGHQFLILVIDLAIIQTHVTAVFQAGIFDLPAVFFGRFILVKTGKQ